MDEHDTPELIEKHGHKCPQEVWDLKNTLEQLKSSRDLQFILREADLEATEKMNSRLARENAIKMSLLYSSRTILVVKPRVYWEGSSIYGTWSVWEQIPWEKQAKPTDPCRLSDLLGELAAVNGIPPSSEDLITIVPEEITVHRESWNYDEWYGEKSNISFKFPKMDSFSFSLPVSFSDPAIAKHFVGMPDPESGSEYRVTNLWLPSLKGLPIDTMIALRRDEEAAFRRLSYALKTFVSGLGEAPSEVALKELFQKVDYEIRKFDTRIKTLKRASRYALGRLAIGSAVVGCCLLLPEEAAKLIAAFIGSYSGRDFVNELIRNRAAVEDLRASDFYAAWKASQRQ